MVTLAEKLEKFNNNLRNKIDKKLYDIDIQTITMETKWNELKQKISEKTKSLKNKLFQKNQNQDQNHTQENE